MLNRGSSYSDGRRGAGRFVKLGLLGAALLAVVFLLVFVVNWGLSKSKKTELYEEGTYLKGVRIEGIDVSNMTISDASNLVILEARDMLDTLGMRFIVGPNTYTLTGTQLGALVDYTSAMKEAMLFGRDGSRLENAKNKKRAEEEGVDFSLKIVLDEEELTRQLEELAPAFSTIAADAYVSIDTRVEEDGFKVYSEVVVNEEVVGRKVDVQKLKEDILEAFEKGMYERPVLAEFEETLPGISSEAVQQNCQLMSEFTTTFESSEANRIYNIWKMSGVTAGITLQPGESWSINAAAGDRTVENGWAEATGISGGAYVTEAGGGICQVSTTLYVALLKAEVEVEKRSHHSWPVDYVSPGLDATISTGGPDLVFKNNYDAPIYITTECDGRKDKKVTVRVYGPPMNYTVDFEVEKIKDDEPLEEPMVVLDGQLAPGEEKWIKPRKNQVVVLVWKKKIDKATGEQVGDRELLYTDTYKAQAGEKAVGPETTTSTTGTGTP